MFIRRSSHDAGLLMRLRKSYSDSFTSPHFKPTKPFPQASTFASSAALRRTASPPLLVWFHRSLKFDTFSRPRPNNPETLKHDIKFRSAKFSSKTDPAETPNEPSDPNPASTPAKLNESEYHALADAYLNELEDKLQELVEVNPRADCEYSVRIIPSPSLSPFSLPRALTYTPPDRHNSTRVPTSGYLRHQQATTEPANLAVIPNHWPHAIRLHIARNGDWRGCGGKEQDDERRRFRRRDGGRMDQPARRVEDDRSIGEGAGD